MKQRPDIQRVIELHRLLHQFGTIERIVHIKRGTQYVQETDTEHSYNLALTAWFLAEYFPALNRDRVIRFALVHDLVEVHAGDTYIFADGQILDNKIEREHAAQERLAQEWPDFPELHTAIAAYEKRELPEARFVYALDKIMPMLAIFINDGQTWQLEQLSLSKLHLNKKDKVKLSPEIAEYYDQLYELLLENQHLFPKS